MMRFAVSAEPIDVASLRDTLHNPRHGGFCAFEGWVRDTNEGRPVGALEYEIFHELTCSEGERILGEAQQRFGDIDAIGIHRAGLLQIGALAVWVGVSSAHRDEAFRACRFIIDQIKHRLPVWKKEHYLSGDTAWVACAHPAAEDEPHHHHVHHHGHHPAETDTGFVADYSRQMRLPEVGERGQARLLAAGVLVIGAGGLGSPALRYLAGAGIGRIGIVDPDRVESSNLHRQTLFTMADLGRPKAQVAAERLRAVNPALQVELFERKLDADNIAQAFARFDLVLDCSDDMRSRFLCSDAAVLTGVPLILASVHQHEGQLQVIGGGGAPCLRCLWPVPPSPDVAGSCVEDGVLGPVPGVLGTMQANEALKLLLGLPTDASLLLVDLLDNSTQQLRIDPEHGCATRGGCVAVAGHALENTMTAIDLRFHSLATAGAEGFHIVDLREAVERASQPMPVAAQWLPSTTLPARMGELPADKPLLLVCAAGRRSAHAARQLREAGLDQAFSLAGGLQALR